MKEKTVLVMGLGRMGSALVEELWDTGVQLLVVDKSAQAIDALKDKASAAFVADASDPHVLEGVGAKDIDVAVVTYGGDFEAMVLTVASLAQLSVRSIIARARNERQAAVLRAVGATRVVLVESEMGRRLVPEVLSPASSHLMEHAASFRVVPWLAAPWVVGRTLAELDLPRRFEISVLGYLRAADTSSKRKALVVPGKDYAVEEGDTLFVIGLAPAIEKFLAHE